MLTLIPVTAMAATLNPWNKVSDGLTSDAFNLRALYEYGGTLYAGTDGGAWKTTATTPSPATSTITFDPNGGTVSPTSSTTGSDGKLVVLPTPTRSGYIFKGWFTAASGGTQITTSKVFSANTTIYAQWTSTGGSSSSGGGGGGATTSNSVSPAAANFDKTEGAANNKDIVISLTVSSGSLSAIKNGNAVLVEGTDYTISGNSYTIKESYLATDWYCHTHLRHEQRHRPVCYGYSERIEFR